MRSYRGGALAVHVRVGNPLFSHGLFPTYVGAMIWGGLYLRTRALARSFLSYDGVSAPKEMRADLTPTPR